MSLYRRARRHALKMLVYVLIGAVFIAASDQIVGHSAIAFAIVIFGLFMANIGILAFNCPRCRSNLFFRQFLVVPWPNRTCSRCGLDLTRVD